MSTYFDLDAASAILKDLYDGQPVTPLTYKKNPLWAMLKKNTDFVGAAKPIPLTIAPPGGRSSTFSSALSDQASAEAEKFLLTRVSDYQLATIDNETMEACGTDKGAFIQAVKYTVDLSLQNLVNSLSSGLFRGGTGTIGQIDGITSGVITLASVDQSFQFEKNMVVQANSTDGGTPRAALGYVTAVDRSAGTVTVSATGLGGAAGSPSGWTSADYLLVRGDNNAKITGLAGWVPLTAPGGSDSFFGLNRSSEPTRLAGIRMSGANKTHEEALIDLAMGIGEQDGSPDICVMSWHNYSAFVKQLGSKVQYVDQKVADVSFRGVQIIGAGSDITVFADRNCPRNRAYMLTSEDWSFESLGEAPKIQREPDGLKFMRVGSADAGELRLCYYGNLACSAPGRSGVTSLAT